MLSLKKDHKYSALTTKKVPTLLRLVKNSPENSGEPTPPSNQRFFLVLMLLSLVVHGVVLFLLFNAKDSSLNLAHKEPVRIRIMPSKKRAVEKKDAELKAEKILENNQEETDPAKDPAFLANQNHQAEKNQRTKWVFTKVKDPGAAQELDGANSIAEVKEAAAKGTEEGKSESRRDQKRVEIGQGPGKSADQKRGIAKGKSYADFMRSTAALMQQQVKAGYQDYLDQAIAEGDTVDLNTQEYRFISYFTGMRKAIELVWNYPLAAARRGIHGKVGLAFTIEKDGKVSKIKVLDSSGHQILDSAIVDAIRLAAPFAPLPQDMGRKSLHVTGTFNYILR